MSKAVKAMIATELKERYADSDSACVIDLTGMSVQEQEQLRKNLREKSARLQVVKNSLARRAFQGGPLEPLGDALEGPCALVTSSESLIETAKVLVKAAEEFNQLELKQAILDGDPGLLTVTDVSKMKSRTELVGELVMLAASPGRALAACLASPQSRIAGCLKAIVNKAA
ncbi:MAG: 50S ribosomal protein L10 [Phycisphaerales bacterium]|nr:MAG: 50S ribosomal protein L10 [Phycisphaerales bacterium]